MNGRSYSIVWIAAAIALGLVGACAVSFPEYTVGTGGSGSSSGSSTSSASSSTGTMSGSSSGTGGASTSSSSSGSTSTGSSSSTSSGWTTFASLGFTATTFDITPSGAGAAVGPNLPPTAGNPLQVQCFGVTGQSTGTYTVPDNHYATASTSLQSDLAVAVGSGAPVTSVAWSFIQGTTTYSSFVILDSQCTPMSGPTVLVQATQPLTGLVTRLTPDGSYAAFAYDSTALTSPYLMAVGTGGGAPIQTPLTLTNTCEGGWGVALGMSPSTNTAIAVCKANGGVGNNGAVYGFVYDFATSTLTNGGGGTFGSGKTDPLLVEYGLGGDLFVAGYNVSNMQWDFDFNYPGNGNNSPAPYSTITGFSNDRILLHPSGDFIVPFAVDATNNAQRFVQMPDGGIASAVSTHDYIPGTPFRLDDANQVYALFGTSIARKTAIW